MARQRPHNDLFKNFLPISQPRSVRRTTKTTLFTAMTALTKWSIDLLSTTTNIPLLRSQASSLSLIRLLLGLVQLGRPSIYLFNFPSTSDNPHCTNITTCTIIKPTSDLPVYRGERLGNVTYNGSEQRYPFCYWSFIFSYTYFLYRKKMARRSCQLPTTADSLQTPDGAVDSIL